MAVTQIFHLDNLAYSKSKLRPKIVGFLAGLLVLSYVFYASNGAGLFSATGVAINEDEQLVLGTPPATRPASPVTVTVTVNVLPTADSDPASHLIAPGGSLNSVLSPNAPRAVIIETSIIPTLIPIMLHFFNVLGPAWGMTLFTMEDTYVEPLSPVFQRGLKSGRIEVRFLPKEADLKNSKGVSVFLTQPWFWEQVASAERILMFQADSILCSKSQDTVDAYLKYDYCGAPIDPQYGAGYNGGLSIRNPRLFLDIVTETPFATSGHEFEDQFFYEKLKERHAEMPSVDVAKLFSVETIYYETPLGYHQPQRWQENNIEAIETWCPEVKMLIGRRAT